MRSIAGPAMFQRCDAQFVMASLALLAMLAATPAARADDAYVCDEGRLVYARPETLEKLKQTDPCIAGYYGIDLGKSKVVANAAKPAPAFLKAPTATPSEAASANQRASANRAGRHAPAAAPAPPVSALKSTISTSPTQPAPNTNFRDVRVLNAAPGSATTFHHAR